MNLRFMMLLYIALAVIWAGVACVIAGSIHLANGAPFIWLIGMLIVLLIKNANTLLGK